MTLTNTDWNLNAGDTLNLDFLVRWSDTSAERPEVIGATFDGQDVCEGGSGKNAPKYET